LVSPYSKDAQAEDEQAGGVGLNLTRGNRVVSLDLGWSQSVDQQAFDRSAELHGFLVSCSQFDRCHRLGQQKEVFIERLVISNTVEQRVQAIQARKQALADGALGEGTGQRMRLSVGELAQCEYRFRPSRVS
jgi:SNF2 family DNA or RNA helicase